MEFLESVYLPYHIPIPFSGFWSFLEGFFYVFFRCNYLNNVRINVNGITCNIMFKSLPINYLWFISFGVIYLDSSRTVNFFDDIRAFPFGEKFACKMSETRLVQKNFITNIKFSFLNSFIMPSFNFFFKQLGIFISLSSPFI